MNAAIRGEPSEVYHATDAISHSKLEVFRRRPALYHRKYVMKVVPDADSSAFAIGRATHAAVLEPQPYGTLYARRPDGIDRRTKEGKAAWEQFAQANVGKTILDGEDFALVEQMLEAGWRILRPRSSSTPASLSSSGASSSRRSTCRLGRTGSTPKAARFARGPTSWI